MKERKLIVSHRRNLYHTRRGVSRSVSAVAGFSASQRLTNPPRHLSRNASGVHSASFAGRWTPPRWGSRGSVCPPPALCRGVQRPLGGATLSRGRGCGFGQMTDIARAFKQFVTRPRDIAVNEILIRPTEHGLFICACSGIVQECSGPSLKKTRFASRRHKTRPTQHPQKKRFGSRRYAKSRTHHLCARWHGR